MRRRKKPGITQVLLIAVVLLLLVVGGGFLGLTSWIGSFLRGEEFRTLVSEKTGKFLDAEASFGSFEWTGPNVFTERFSANGLEGSRIGSLTANQVRATVDWRAAWGGAWKVKSIDILELDVLLRTGESSKPVKVEEPALPKPAAKAGWLPQRFELGLLRANQGTVRIIDSKGDQTVLLSKSVLTLEPKGTSYDLMGKGGTLEILKVPPLSLETAQARVSDGTFYLTRSSFQLEDSGRIEASGEFGNGSTLQLTWSDVNVTPFLDKEWQSKLTGQMSGEATITWPAEKGPSTATGKFVLTNGRLENVPVLEQVAIFTSSPQFRRMPLQEISGNFERQGELLTVTDFVGESKGLMRLEGGFQVGEGSALSGTFRIGVSPQVLQWVPGSRERVFTENRDGYVWTDLRVGGTLAQPSENLSARLARAMGDQVVEDGTQILKEVPEGAVEGVRGVLDALSPLLNR